MNKLTAAHKAEILKRMLKRESPTETNMGEQTPPGIPQGGPMLPGMGGPTLPGMGMSMGGIPGAIGNAPPMPNAMPNTSPLQIENAESYDKNPSLDLGNQLIQKLGLEQNSKTKTTLTPIDEVIKSEASASQIWKIMGGYDSVAGKYWQELSNKSKLYNTGRDYFIHSYSKYMQNPGTFKKDNPRESLLFENINKIMGES